MDSWMNVTPGSLNIQRAHSPTPTVRRRQERAWTDRSRGRGVGDWPRTWTGEPEESGGGGRIVTAGRGILSGRETREEGRRPGGARREQPPSFDPVFIGAGRLHGRFRPGRPGPNRRIFPCVQVGWVALRGRERDRPNISETRRVASASGGWRTVGDGRLVAVDGRAWRLFTLPLGCGAQIKGPDWLAGP